MFICAITGKPSKLREPRTMIILQTRDVQYIKHEDGLTRPRTEDEIKKNFIPAKWEAISRGTEIVKEIGVSAEGFARFQAALDSMALESEPS